MKGQAAGAARGAEAWRELDVVRPRCLGRRLEGLRVLVWILGALADGAMVCLGILDGQLHVTVDGARRHEGLAVEHMEVVGYVSWSLSWVVTTLDVCSRTGSRTGYVRERSFMFVRVNLVNLSVFVNRPCS